MKFGFVDELRKVWPVRMMCAVLGCRPAGNTLGGHGLRVCVFRATANRALLYDMRQTLHTEIALNALTKAINRQRPAPGLIQYSDRGIQYAAEAYRSALARSGITPSMSRKGDCWDNAPMESLLASPAFGSTPSRPNGSTTGSMPPATRPGGICSNTSRASTIPADCTQPWAKSAQPRPSAERHNPVHFFGGRSMTTASPLTRYGTP